MQGSVKDQVAQVLSDPINLPPEFLNYLMQYAAMNSLPQAAVAAPTISSTGLTGSTKSSRIVGSTTSGAPTQGTFQAGDEINTRDGHKWVCTLAGSPGTWVDASVAPIQAATSVTFSGDVHLTTAGNTLEQSSALLLKSAVANPITAPVLSTGGGGTLTRGTTFMVGYTWVDGSGHESAISPIASVTTPAHGGSTDTWTVNVSVPSLPVGATGFHIYATSSSGPKRQAAPTYVTSETVSPTKMIAYNSSGAAAPGSTTFPAGTAALIEDAGGNTLLSGNGIVRGAQPRVTGSPTGTTSVTPDFSQGSYFAYSYSGGPGTVTVNAPAHAPTSSQSALLFLDFTNAASGGTLTYSWDAAYQSTVTTLPATTGTSTSARLMFVWNGSNWLLYTKT